MQKIARYSKIKIPRQRCPMFMSLKVPRGSLDDELAFVCDEIAALSPPVYLPKLFLKIGLYTIRSIENHLHAAADPGVGIDFALTAQNSAQGESRSIVRHSDIAAALHAAILKNIPAKHALEISESVVLNAPNSARFLQNELPECDFSLLIQKVHSPGNAGSCITPEYIKKALLTHTDFPELESVCRWVMNNETIQHFRIYEVIAAYVNAYKDGIALELQARSRRFNK
jgi:hypothetical protein